MDSHNLRDLYVNKLSSELQKKLKLSNIMQVPRLAKIVINVGVKEAVANNKVLTSVIDSIQRNTGQRHVKVKARKSIAGFKLRAGMPIGVKVTLRRERMYDFLYRLINLALPKMRDFQGVSRKFDGRGNYNLGIKESIIFPELDYDTIDRIHGLNITFETTSNDDNAAFELLKSFGMPFKESDLTGVA